MSAWLYAAGFGAAVILYVLLIPALARGRGYIFAVWASDATVLGVGAVVFLVAELVANVTVGRFMAIPPWFGALELGYFVGWLIDSILTFALLVFGIDIDAEAARIQRSRS